MIDIQKGRHGAIYEIKLLFFTKWFFLFSNCHMIETVSIYCISRKSFSSHFVMFDVVLGREKYTSGRGSYKIHDIDCHHHAKKEDGILLDNP